MLLLYSKHLFTFCYTISNKHTPGPASSTFSDFVLPKTSQSNKTKNSFLVPSQAGIPIVEGAADRKMVLL